MDSIGDFLTRIRNAQSAGHRVLEVPGSKLKREITKVLFENGYILNYKFEENEFSGTIKIALKYNIDTKQHGFRVIERASTPGLRRYSGVETLPRVLNGLGIAIMSTSRGVMTNKEARKLNIGGEVLCYVY